MDNIKSNMAKNKKVKIFFCYISLVFLIALLFTPLVFKIVFKAEKNEKKDDVVTRLECNKGEEIISSTFFNDKPQNILYRIKGNYMTNGNSEGSENGNNENEDNIGKESLVLKKFLNYSNIMYDEENNTSSISFNVEVTNGTVDYELIFINIANQEEYFRTQGFSCKRSTM